MQLKHLKTIHPAKDSPNNVLSLAWSPNNLKLAVCNYDRVILLFDENGNRKDKFSTKPFDSKNTRMSYSVKGLAFSPDSTKIAVGQTDNIIYIYKVGEDWGDKKVICNKFPQHSSITCLVWLNEGPIIFGQADGKVRAAYITSNKTQTLYNTYSYVVSLAVNSRGTGFLSGHDDGSIVRFYVTDDSSMEQQGRVLSHSCPPYALAWPGGGFIIAAGCDQRVSVYDRDGRLYRQFDYPNEKEFTVAVSSPSGQAVVVGSFDRLRTYIWSPRKQSWDEIVVKEIENLYTITALSWKRDGSRIVCGGLCGSVELFESVVKRSIWKNKFELTYVGASQVLVKPLDSDSRGVILRSRFGHEIDDVRILGNDRYLLARTPETLLLGDLERNLLSEVDWQDSDRKEKFYLDNPNVCLIFNAGELTLVEYGNNDILTSVRTEFMNPFLISVRINERKLPNSDEDNKKLAYLLDRKTVCIVDLIYGIQIMQVSHDAKIDWLELNETGHKLLFRDKKSRLYLLDTRTALRQAILSYCSYVQWVPGSDVVVAQSRSQACVWYNIDTPDRVTTFPIKGEIIDIVRENKKTEILTQEGTHQTGYELDEGLVEFGTAVHDSDFGRAILFLESLSKNSPETEAMWHNLAEITLPLNNLRVALRCYAALGDIPKTHFLNETLKISEKFAKENGGDGMDCPEVWARMAILNKQLKTAEAIYLEQNQIDKALEMYKELHKWEEALSLAETSGYIRFKELKEEYVDWLMSAGQQEKAGQVKQDSGQLLEAVDLYLSAGLPATAARVVISQPDMLDDAALMKRLTNALVTGELFLQAGQVFEAAGDNQRAMQCYRQANAFATALHLARIVAPKEVVTLEEEWGDHLVQTKQLDAAINHYIEAGQTVKALDAAIGARQWKKAVQIIQVIEDVNLVSNQYNQLCSHFASVKDFEVAEKLFANIGLHQEAVKMYFNAGHFLFVVIFNLALHVINGAVKKHCSGQDEKSSSLMTDFQLAYNRGPSDKERRSGGLKGDDLTDMIIHIPEYYTGGFIMNEWMRSEWEKAYQFASGSLDKETIHNMFLNKAKEEESLTKYRDAETLFVLIGEVDLAISMYKTLRQHDQMLRLVKEYRNDLLAVTNLHLAKQLEEEGNVQGAEELYVAAGEWPSAVNMLRGHKMWEQAYRVARQNGGEQAGKHVIFAWAKTLGGESAAKLLNKYNLLSACIEYACDSNQFEFAFELAKTGQKIKLPEIHHKYALYLEARDELGLAEEHFERSGKLKDAVLMYLDHKQWDAAERVAEKVKEDGLVEDVLTARAAEEFSLQNYSKFEALCLRARKPETIVNMYKDAGLWMDALRICREYLPSKLTVVQAEYEKSVASKGARDATLLFNEARQWEVSGQYSTAISCYLKVNNSNCSDPNMIVKALTEAARLTINYLDGEEAYDVVKVLGGRLVEQKQYHMAAQLFLGVDMIKEAIDTFIITEEWQKALKVARELEPRYVSYVESRHKESLRTGGRADQLADVDLISGLDLLCEQGHWQKAVDMASQHGPSVLNKYVALYATHLIKSGNTWKALELYNEFKPAAVPQNYNIYRRIAMETLSTHRSKDSFDLWVKLRDMFFNLNEALSISSDSGTQIQAEFEQIMLIGHYYSLRFITKSVSGLETLTAKISISMLRNSDVIPADKAYYEAGIDAKDAGWSSDAFIFLNHCLDLLESMEEGGTAIDYSDLTKTDFPHDVPLPANQHMSEDEVEDIKQWVLSVSMDQNVETMLPLDSRGVYSATLRSSPACLVTGYPVPERQRIAFKRDGIFANSGDWQKLTSALSSHPYFSQILAFITSWAGPPPSAFSFV